MKLKHYFNVSLFGVVSLLAFAGCSDDINGGGSDLPKGNGIVFGTSAGYAGNNTRVAYGDYVFDGTGTGFMNRISQDIEWVDGDQVSVYSPTSPSLQQVDYDVANIRTDDKSKAYLAAINGQDGLQWDRSTANSTQDFYAVYPSKASIVNSAVRNSVSFENGVLTGYVPINQQHTITHSGEHGWTATPNMDYLYMAAIQKGFNVPAADDPNAGISLDFVPLTTTLEITFVGPTTIPIAAMNVEANGVPVAGLFRCDLKEAGNTTDNDFENTPVCESLQQSTTNDYITVSTYWNDNGTNRPLELEAGEEITFNVFLLPTAPLTNVTITVSGFNSGERTMSLAGRVTLSQSKKSCIRINAPQIQKGETNEWITNLNSDVLISQLSIPGTANSFSYRSNQENNKTQSNDADGNPVDIETQWNAGIRCFELVCPENGGNVEDAQLQCNRTNFTNGITFGEAVQQIWTLLRNNPGEFAMIIPSYDSGTGHPSDHSGVRNFFNGLNAFFGNHPEYEYETYKSDLTVGQARGKLLFISRITSEEDGELNLGAPDEGVLIHQWGSLRDNWRRRGYTLSDGTRVNNWSTGNNDRNSVEYYMLNSTSNLPTRVEGNVDFIHTTTRSDGSPGRAYIQDWARVVPSSSDVSGLRDGNFSLEGSYILFGRTYTGYIQDVYWQESLTEKKNDIWTTFLTCIEDNSGKTGSAFYINSLDGYFVDENIDLSYKPYVQNGTLSSGRYSLGLGDGGTAGNISAWATYINNWFYNRILDYGEDRIYGPLNIILLDRVYTDNPGSYLPSVIINNNYRFPLVKADGSTTGDNEGTQTTGAADGSYVSGGSIWY